MTDDNDEAVERVEEKNTIRHSYHGNLTVKVKPYPSEAYKIAPR